MSNVDGERFVRGVICSARSDHDVVTMLLQSEYTPENIVDILCDEECRFMENPSEYTDGNWEEVALDKVAKVVL